MRMRPLPVLAALPLLAACDLAMTSDKPIEVSEAALAALPEGVDPGFLIKDADGCYGIVIEVAPEGEPASGPALLDAEGNQVCDT